MTTSGERRGPTPGHLLAAVLVPALLLALIVRRGAAVLVPGGGSPRSDCLAQLDIDGVTTASSRSAVQCTEGDPCDHDGCGNNSCRFQVALCLNRSTSSCTPPAGGLKKVVPKGLLKRLRIAVPDLKSSVCGAFLGVDVALKKNGKKKGKTTLALVAISTARPKKDSDAVTLTCLPRQGACPPATTTTTVVSTTTTTTLRCGNGIIDTDEQCDPPGTQVPQCPAGQACNAQCQCETVTCAPIVPGQPIPNTYTLLSVAGPKLCTAAAPEALRFKPCQSDADCGGGGNTCFPTPWVAVGPITEPTPVGVSTTFTVAAADSPPSCQHAACIKCGNPSAACTPITGGCSDPSNDCKFGAQCCDDPGFVIPAIFIDLGIFKVCSLLNQLACGLGVVDTANPQTGDNEVMKVGDTSDPGPDCVYGTSDDPPAKSCDTAGAGNDHAGPVDDLARQQPGGVPAECDLPGGSDPRQPADPQRGAFDRGGDGRVQGPERRRVRARRPRLHVGGAGRADRRQAARCAAGPLRGRRVAQRGRGYRLLRRLAPVRPGLHRDHADQRGAGGRPPDLHVYADAGLPGVRPALTGSRATPG